MARFAGAESAFLLQDSPPTKRRERGHTSKGTRAALVAAFLLLAGTTACATPSAEGKEPPAVSATDVPITAPKPLKVVGAKDICDSLPRSAILTMLDAQPSDFAQSACSNDPAHGIASEGTWTLNSGAYLNVRILDNQIVGEQTTISGGQMSGFGNFQQYSLLRGKEKMQVTGEDGTVYPAAVESFGGRILTGPYEIAIDVGVDQGNVQPGWQMGEVSRISGGGEGRFQQVAAVVIQNALVRQ